MASSSLDAPWTLKDAISLIQLLEPMLRVNGFSLGVTGSVLFKGKSKKDLDLIVYPMVCTDKTDFNKARKTLKIFGMKLHEVIIGGKLTALNVNQMHKYWRSKGSLDEKEVEVWNHNGKRVDVFFLRSPSLSSGLFCGKCGSSGTCENCGGHQ